MATGTQVLVFASQKGGSGKTTLSGHVAVEAERSGGGPVALIDCDPQGSLASWWNAREADTPSFAHTTPLRLRDDLEALRHAGFRLIVIDTPPAVTGSISEIVSYADLVIVPTRPSPHDLRAVGTTVDIVDLQKKHLVFVINAATARARITGETAVALSQHGTVAPVMIHNRVDFAASMIDGRSVGEINSESRSAKEIAALWAYLGDRLARMRASPSELVGAPPRRTFEENIFTGLGGPREMAVQQGGNEEEIGWLEESPPHAEPVAASGPVAPASPSWMPHPAAEPALRGLEVHDRREARAQDQSQAPVPSWDGVERRKHDHGPPPGMPERRGVPVFGRRGQS